MPTQRMGSRHVVSYLDLFLCSAVDCYPGSLMVVALSGAETGNFEGLRYVRDRGARIVVQDPTTCMMAAPLAAVVEAGLAENVAAPDSLADHIRSWAAGTAMA
jgi:chemotaxis response regulator CheB